MQLQIHVKNLRSSRTADNVVKVKWYLNRLLLGSCDVLQHYYKTKEVKIPFKDEPTASVVQLPNWVLVSDNSMLHSLYHDAVFRHTNTNKRKLLRRILLPHRQLQAAAKSSGLLQRRHHMIST